MKKFYIWSTIVFLIAYVILILSVSIPSGEHLIFRGGSLMVLYLSFSLHLFFFAIIYLGPDLNRGGATLISIFNYLALFFLFYLSNSYGFYYFFQIFFWITLLFGVNFLPHLVTVIFFVKNSNLTKEQQSQIKYWSIWKSSLVFSIIFSPIILWLSYNQHMYTYDLFSFATKFFPPALIICLSVGFIFVLFINLIKQLIYLRKLKNSR